MLEEIPNEGVNLKGYSRPQNKFRLKVSIWTIIKGKWHKKCKRRKKKAENCRRKAKFTPFSRPEVKILLVEHVIDDVE